MSQWTHVDASLGGVGADLSDEPTPQGSEGGQPLRSLGHGSWYWHADLRDRGEEDAPEIRDWFAALCKRVQARKASLEIDVEYGGRYEFDWDGERLVLDVPPLYREALSPSSGTS